MSPYPFRLSFFEKATKGQFVGVDRSFSTISIDSRTIDAESLFIAIKGEQFDGHDFVLDVLQRGVKGIVIRKDAPFLPDIQGNKDISILLVEDTFRALGDMAKAYKESMPVKTVAITGSAGKTSTRELVSLVLNEKFSVLTPEKNFNNEIGVPLTIFRLRPSHEWIVLELGMSTLGEIARLTDICQPEIGVITHIGPAHLAGVGGTLEGVLSAKTELFTHMNEQGTAVINIDDTFLAGYLPRIQQKKVTYGTSPSATIYATDIDTSKGTVVFKVVAKNTSEPITLHTFNPFMVSNALAATAVGLEAGLDLKEIAIGLQKFSPIRGRMMPIFTKKKILIIDDTYNANPSSMTAALRSLKDISCTRKIAVLGDMGELGEQSQKLHTQLGKEAAFQKIDRLYVIGEFATDVANGAIQEGLPEKHILIGTYDDVISDLTTYVTDEDVVLVKGSRFMKMEKIVAPLVEWANRT